MAAEEKRRQGAGRIAPKKVSLSDVFTGTKISEKSKTQRGIYLGFGFQYLYITLCNLSPSFILHANRTYEDCKHRRDKENA